MNVTPSIRKTSASAAAVLLLVPGFLLTEQVLSPTEALPSAGAASLPESVDTYIPFGGRISAEAVSLDCAEAKCVALTFDDGPGEYTDELLDVLDEKNAPSTFYVLGSKVGGDPEALERMDAEGHEVGNHSWAHDDLADLSGDEIKKDLARTDEAIREIIGSAPESMRPPYGSLNDTVKGAVDLPMILWDVDTLDWQSRDADTVTDEAVDNASPGSVLLFHDIHESSVDAIPGVIEGLREDGYHFVTVSDLGKGSLEPGKVFTDARR